MDRFRNQFGDYELGSLSVDNILDFMNQLTEGRKLQTKRGRFTPKIKTQFDILDKETVDEIIFRTVHPRNRLMLELMARGAMRIGNDKGWIPSPGTTLSTAIIFAHR